MKSYFEKVRNSFHLETLLRILFVCGIVLYLRQYLANRPLWLDEAMVSLNIIRYSIFDFLSQPLPYHKQAAPFGFLVIEKLATYLFGISEYALRLFPLICGFISLWLFSLMAKVYLQRRFVLFALFGFVITPALVYYSSEVKPYYSDVFFVLLSYVVIAQSCLGELNWHKAGMMGLLGAIMIWFSFPVVFVLAGIAATLLLTALIQRDWPRFSKVGFISFFWFISFIFYYAVSLHNIIRVQGPISYWASGYISFVDANSWLVVFNNILGSPLGFSNCLWLAGSLFFIGGYSFFKEDKKKFFFLLTPLIFVFLVSGLHKYSCKTRLALFLVPIFFVLIINGVRTVSLRMKKYGLIIDLLLIGILFYGSLFAVGKGFLNPKNKEDVRSVISYVHGYKQAGDAFCIYTSAEPAILYYNHLFGYSFPKKNYKLSTYGDLESIKKDLDQLRSIPRVWLVFSHIKSHDQQRDDDLSIKYLLQSGGKLLDKFSSVGAGAYLFDLSYFLDTNAGSSAF
jgi:hypothetical protein